MDEEKKSDRIIKWANVTSSVTKSYLHEVAALVRHTRQSRRHEWRQTQMKLHETGCRQHDRRWEVTERKKEQVFIMVSNSDTLALRPVPVHPSSSSPTDEHWKQIWGSRALFCRLGDLSESSQARVSLYPSPTDVSQDHFHPLGTRASRLPPPHLPCLLCLSFSFLLLLLCQSPVFIKFFIYLTCFSCLSVCWLSVCIYLCSISCETQRASITVT